MFLSKIKKYLKNKDLVDLIPLMFALQDNRMSIIKLKNRKPISSGVSTIVFDHEDINMIYGLTVDLAKINYLKKEKTIPRFKFLEIIFYNDGREDVFAYLYQMEKLTPIEDKSLIRELNYIRDLGQDKEFCSDDVISELENLNIDIDFCNLNFLLEKYDARTDFHSGQFMMDKNNKLVCFDPIISNNIYF